MEYAMDDLLAALFGSYWSDLRALISQYWLVPVGALVLVYYGKFHFNTPDYVLSSPRRGEHPRQELAFRPAESSGAADLHDLAVAIPDL
jgi:hypothetical protein